MRWLLTFSHDANSWLACNRIHGEFVVPWTRVPPAMARDLAGRGYVVIDAI